MLLPRRKVGRAMERNFQTHLLIGILSAAVLGAGGYGLYKESKRKQARQVAAMKSQNSGSDAALNSGAEKTGFRIETVAVVSANATGLEAKAVGAPGLSFEWSIQGGKLETWNQREAILWTAGAAGEAVLNCRGFDAAGMEFNATAKVKIQPLSAISVFDAVPATVILGTSAKLGWTVKDCKKLVLDPGGQDVTALTGPGLEVKPLETTTYKLTATDVLGKVTTRELTLKVVPPPQIDSLRADPKPGNAGAFVVIAEFRGGTAELKDGNTVLASGSTSPLRADISGVKAGSSVSLRVTSEAGSSVSSSLPFLIKKP